MFACKALALMLLVAAGSANPAPRTKFVYPEVRRQADVVDDYFGTKVEDPYRWLEDDNSEETANFVKEQQDLTENYLSGISVRDDIRKRLTQVWNYERMGTYEKVNGKYYFFRNEGLQNQSILYVKDSIDGEARVFLDPNKLSEDGTVAMGSYTFSADGSKFAYEISESGSDWKVVRFRDLAVENKDLPDELKNTKWPGASWCKDGSGVFYARYPKQETKEGASGVTVNSKIYYHKLGTSQDDDILIAEFPKKPKSVLSGQVTEDGKKFIINTQESFGSNTIHYIDLSDGINEELKNNVVSIYPDDKAAYNYVHSDGDTLYFVTNEEAPRYKINKVVLEKVTNGQNRTEVKLATTTLLAENDKDVISWAYILNRDKMIVSITRDVQDVVEIRSLKDGSLLQTLDLPVGTVSGLKIEDSEDKEFFFSVVNSVSPGTYFRCVEDDEENKVVCKVYHQTKVSHLDLDEFEVKQVFYKSKDGTKIPMFITKKKTTPLDGTAPTMLYGYGGFNAALSPSFSITNLVFAGNFDGIYAVANIRGGGEYGEAWHLAGNMLNKQNVFDDFQAAAEYLIENKYTQKSKLAIYGASNGGTLVGACVNQRPDLYGAAVAGVGVMDMLRFQHFTIGYAWCPEYGCSDNQTHFENLYKYSPLHNIKVPEDPQVQYPAVMVTTADHDDRVVPAHSFKYTAQLQHVVGSSSKQTNPLLLRVDIKAGHGAGKPTSKRIDEYTDMFAFFSDQLKAPFKA